MSFWIVSSEELEALFAERHGSHSARAEFSCRYFSLEIPVGTLVLKFAQTHLGKRKFFQDGVVL